MPDIGDLRTATLTVDPSGPSTTGVLTAYAPDGTTTTPSVSGNGTGTLTAVVTYTAAGWWLLKWVVTGTGAGTEYQRVFVPVAPVYGDAPAYASLERFKNRLNVTATGDDEELTEAIDSGAREIDTFCGRRFWTDTASAARRYYPLTTCTAYVDDFWSTTGLVVALDDGSGTYPTTLTLDADFLLEPLDGVVDGSAGWPYSKIRLLGGRSFPSLSGRPPLRLTTDKWGWAKIPKPVTQANLIMGQANYKLKDVAFGAAGVGDLGIVTVRQVPAAMTKLAPYRRDPVLVA